MELLRTSWGANIGYLPASAAPETRAFFRRVLVAAGQAHSLLSRHCQAAEARPAAIWVNAVGANTIDALPDDAGCPLVLVCETAAAERFPLDRFAVVCVVGPPPERAGLVHLGEDAMAEARLAKLLSHLAAFPAHRPSSPVDFPMTAMVEVVRACNLACPLCPVGNGSAHKYPNMSVPLFRRIVQAIAPTVFHLELYNYGEPLLHRRLHDLVAIAKAHGIEWVELTTNGTLFPKRAAERLIAAGLDMIRFAVDGATQESYQRYRVGGKLSDVWRHLHEVAALRARLGTRKPRIELQMIVNRHNEHEIDRVRQEAEAAGVDSIKLKTFNAYMSGNDFVELGRQFLPREGRHSRYHAGPKLLVRDRYKLASCEWPWQRLVVNADGAVVPCCYDYNGAHPLGHFHARAPAQNWWSTPERAAFRAGLRADPFAIPMCAVCPVGIPNLDVEPAQPVR